MKKLIITFILIILLYNLSAIYYGLIDPDEPRYATTSKNMVINNNYLVPYFNGKLRINKPPLTYWLIATSFKLFKINEYFSRLPHIICAILILLFGLIISGNYLTINEKTNFLIILSTTPIFFYLGKYCNTDIILSLFFVFSVYFYYLFYEKEKKIFLYLFYISYLLANLAKGPVAYLIILIIGIFLFIKKDFKKLLNIKFITIIILFSLTPFFYLLIVSLKVNNSLNILSLIITETIGRFVKGYRHPEPFYFYVKYFPLIFFPWSLFFILYLFKLKSLWKKNDFNKLNIIFFFTVFIFFSLSKSKLLSYIMPATIPFAFLVTEFTENIKINFNYKYFSYIFGIIFSGIIIFLILKKYALPDYKILIIYLIVTIILIFNIRNEKKIISGIGYSHILILSTIFIIGANFISENKSEKFLKNLIVKENIPIISYRRNITGIAFYLNRYIKCDNINLLKNYNEFYLISYKSDFNKIKNNLNCNLLSESKLKIMAKCYAIKNK